MRTIEEIKADISENNKNQLANRFERSHALITEFLYAVTDEITFDRLQEICQAERDGRCVVLPCKAGDKVWIIKNNNIHGNFAVQYHLADNKEQSFLSMHGEYCNFTDFGKTIFLTREEAEQALKGGAE